MTRSPVVTMTAPANGSAYLAIWTVRFRYNADLVELLKAMIDWRDREWDADARCWYVHPADIETLADAMRAEGATVRLVDSGGQPLDDTDDSTGSGAGNSDDGPPDFAVPTWAEAMLNAVGPDRRDAVFRALSKVLHPDTETGDNALMRELIAARELVTRCG